MTNRILALVASSFLLACSSTAPTGHASVQQASACPVYSARPDPRDCFFPWCGGWFLHLVTQPSNFETCWPDFTDPYVTGIFIRNDDGTLRQVYPACSDPLTGNFEPDPENPGFRIFVLYACY